MKSLEIKKRTLDSLIVIILIAFTRFTSAQSVHWGCNSLSREVALTFDDGPGDYTEDLLDILKENGVRATFFVVGLRGASKYPETIQRMIREGHNVGSHTWTHANLTGLLDPNSAIYNPKQFEDEIIQNEELLISLTGKRPIFFRPPYGAINKDIVKYLKNRGYTIILWNSGCIDWYFQDHELENKAYLAGMADTGGLICLHDIYSNVLNGTRELISLLRTTDKLPYANPQGRRIVTLEECLSED